MKKELSKEEFIKESDITDQEFEVISKYIMIRMNKGISQRNLEKLTGISQVTIARIEKNVNSATLSTFIKLVSALGYHIELVKNKEK